MIIWSGFGIGVLFYGVGVIFLAEFLGKHLPGMIGMDLAVARTLGWVIGGILLWPIGKWMNAGSDGVLVDPASGKRYRRGSGHTFFFIPVQFWAFLIPLLGVYMNLIHDSGGSTAAGRRELPPQVQTAPPPVTPPAARTAAVSGHRAQPATGEWTWLGQSKTTPHPSTWIFQLRTPQGNSVMAKIGQNVQGWTLRMVTGEGLVLEHTSGREVVLVAPP